MALPVPAGFHCWQDPAAVLLTCDVQSHLPAEPKMLLCLLGAGLRHGSLQIVSLGGKMP